MSEDFWREVIQLFIFAIFVEALTEIGKDVRSLHFNNLQADEKRAIHLRFFGFAVGIIICYAFDYGVMVRVIQVGERVRSWAFALDYVMTSATIVRGAAWFFSKISASIETANATKAKARTIIEAAPPLTK